MDRRHFVKALAGTAVVAGATRAVHAGQQVAENTRDRVSEKMEALEARVDKMEHHHRNLLRVGALAVAVSTGIDLTLIL